MISYRNFVKGEACVQCGTTECIDIHHLIGHGRYSSKRVEDWFAFPLCRQHHDDLHADLELWEATFGNQYEHIAKTLAMYLRSHSG